MEEREPKPPPAGPGLVGLDLVHAVADDVLHMYRNLAGRGGGHGRGDGDAQVLPVLELGALLQRKPRVLSGGQRQRVAMGRAIGRGPAVFLFVAALGYSRRTYVLLSLHERQSAWLLGLEGAFRHFGGVTHEVLIDNCAFH